MDPALTSGWDAHRWQRWIAELEASDVPRDVNAWLGLMVVPQHRAKDPAGAPGARRDWGQVYLLSPSTPRGALITTAGLPLLAGSVCAQD